MGDKKMDDNFICFDWAMRRILRDKANFDILNGFLSVVLGQQVEIIELLESEGNMTSAEDKFNRVDLKAKNTRGEIFIVEVQNTKEADYFHRILYGVSKAITEHLQSGDAYGEVKKVYSISIVYFNLGQGNDYAYHGTTVFHGIHDTEDILRLSENQRALYDTIYPSGIFPEYYILKVNNFDQVATTPLEQWVAFLGSGCIPANYDAQGLEQAREKLRIDSLSPQERADYELYSEFERSQRSSFFTARHEGKMEGHAEGLAEGMAKGRAEGREEGRAEGIAKGRAEGIAEGEKKLNEEKINIARNFLSMGIAPEQVAQATGLSLEVINQLSNN